MAAILKNKVVKQVGTIPVKIFEMDASTRATIIGMSIANLTDTNVFISVLVQDDTSVTGYYLKDIPIPTNTSLRALNGGEKLIVAPSNTIYVQSDVDDSVDVIVSYAEIV